MAATRFTKEGHIGFVDKSCKIRMRNDKDVMQYYRDSLAISDPLRIVNQITDEDRSAEFFRGFHPDAHDVLLDRLLPEAHPQAL